MSNSKSEKSSAHSENEQSSPKQKPGEESEEESEVLEESPCGRWQKRREEVLFLDIKIIQKNQKLIKIKYLKL